MGRNKRERKEQEQREMSRRRFLRILGAGALGLSALSAGSLVVYNKLMQDSNKVQRQNNEWNFLTRAKMEEKLEETWDYVTENYVQLFPETDIKEENEEFKELIQEKDEEINKWIIKHKFQQPVVVRVTKTDFGRPEEPEIAENYKRYIERCREHLFERLPMLERVPLELVVLKPGQDFSNVERGKGYIGFSHHYVGRVYVRDENDGRVFVVGAATNSAKSHTRLRYHKKTGEREGYYLFFGMGPIAVGAPFSESLHVAVSKSSHPYIQKAGLKRGILAEETITEGIAQLLALEVSEKWGIPRGREMTEEIIARVVKRPQYALIPASIEWLRRNGIEQGLALYMEDPGKYIEAITRKK